MTRKRSCVVRRGLVGKAGNAARWLGLPYKIPDTLIVTELSRLGRSTSEVITLINELLQRNIRVIIIKQNLDMAQHDMSSKIIVTLLELRRLVYQTQNV